MQALIRLFCGVILLCLSFAVYAQSFRISDIRVEGLQRVSAGTVFSALPIRVGDTVTQDDIQNATRELFKVGFFADVAIKRDGEVLVLVIKERPAINKIVLKGNKAIKTENLMDSLKENNLSEGQIFKRATLEGISQSLVREYVNQGRYGANVKLKVKDLPRNQVKITVTVHEGSPSRIKQINLVGNTVFKENELLDLFELKSSGFWSWLSGNDKYNKEKMKGDLEALESHYLDRGYLKFKVDSSQISLSPNKEKIFVTINVTEGDIYKISEVELAGDPVLDESVVRLLLLTKKADEFSQILMTTSEEMVTKVLGNQGYTFAKVEGITEINEADKTVKITYLIEPGKRAYVNRIDFKGNIKTLDEVLRREMRQMEGGSANSSQIEFSKVRLERLGFFKEVKVENKEVPGTSDQVDVEYTVEEQPSGSMGLQIGYGEVYGLMYSANVTQSNWFGTGKMVGFNFSQNKYQTSYNFSYNDPYFTADGVSRGVNMYFVESDLSYISPYSTNTYGAKMIFGYPISDVERIGFEVGFRNLEVEPTQYSAQEVMRSPFWNSEIKYLNYDQFKEKERRDAAGLDSPLGTFELRNWDDSMVGKPGFLDRHGNEFNDVQMSFSWRRSTLNKGILPDRGAAQSLSAEITLPVGDLSYYKINYTGQTYFPLTNSLTLKLRADLGYAAAYGDLDELPFFEHYYAGGLGSVRGFERSTLGPLGSPRYNEYVVPVVWDDLNANGKKDAGEESQAAYILCTSQIVELSCAEGQLVKTPGSSTQIGRSRGAFGGNVLIQGGAEILFPLPFLKDQRSVQSSLFLDAGNVFDTDCGANQINCYDVSLDEIRSSVGVGLTWISGFGPMTFSYAKPLKIGEFDDDERFQFTMGQTF
ncbi:MAG: outer membrane protein assembly factor BamA [Cellvibrio sp.]|nr:outer membrane protein assembly factor BamA [Cellvibrio sp.]